MKRIMLIASVALLTSCGGRYTGWEQVRIVDSKPSESCQFKAQEACSGVEAKCYKYYKQRATTFSANTIVLEHATRDQATSFTYATGNLRQATTLSGLADYYQCPAN